MSTTGWPCKSDRTRARRWALELQFRPKGQLGYCRRHQYWRTPWTERKQLSERLETTDGRIGSVHGNALIVIIIIIIIIIIRAVLKHLF
jgi:hypothetical protein